MSDATDSAREFLARNGVEELSWGDAVLVLDCRRDHPSRP
jgi:hypothetical protein